MANQIALAERFTPIIDEVYKASAKTEGLDAAIRPDFTNTKTVNVMKIFTSGLGDYSRDNGYPKGDVVAQWEPMTLTEERGKELSVDRMDDEETLNRTFGQVVGQFMRQNVIPELDAYRFAKYASTPGVTTVQATLDATTILPAIDEAMRALDAAEVPEGNRVIYLSTNMRPILNQALTRMWASEGAVSNRLSSYNDVPLVYVPVARFYDSIQLFSGVTLNDTPPQWGFAPATGAVPINFMVLTRDAILQVVKFALPKIFTPDENQQKDAWKFQYRCYHDAFVYEQRASGVYVHKATA